MKAMISVLFVVAVAAIGFSIDPPPPAKAAPPGCSCGGYENTPQDWAQADSCEQATENLRAQGYAQVDCPDGHCARGLVLTAGCHWDSFSGKWQVDGYVEYRCWWCEE
ncbi:MAG TPA: hypothetical protein VNO33_24730 [Kofleriaceae bacterium]|nr:hypothetical protein [Kofleriaceae bacterium]